MKVCGIELKGNEAIIVCLEGDVSGSALVHTEVKKMKLGDSLSQSDVKRFSSQMFSFLKEGNFDAVGIKARATKGRFAGGSVSFKMEALVQLSDATVQVIHGATIKSKTKNAQAMLDGFDVLSYQKEALLVAVYLLLASDN